MDVYRPCSGIQVQFSYLKTLVSKWSALLCSFCLCVCDLTQKIIKFLFIEAVFELCFRLFWMIERSLKFQTAKVGNGS